MIGVLSFVIGSCGLDDDVIDKALDPVAEGTGNIALTTASEVTMGVMNALLSTSGAIGKPTASNLTAQTTLRDKNCGMGGSVDYEESGGTFTASFLDCMDENIVINGDATGTVSGSFLCDGEDLPTTLTGTFNGDVLVDVGGEDVVFDFDQFGVAATNISYGGGCDLVGGTFNATLTGKMSGLLAGETLVLDFGSGSLDVDVISIIDPTGLGDGVSRTVTMNLNGTITIDSPCEKGSLTISATNVMTAQPNVCPFSGAASYSGDFGSASLNFDGSCDFVACELAN